MRNPCAPLLALVIGRRRRFSNLLVLAAGGLVVWLWVQPAQARSLREILLTGELRVCFTPVHPSIVSAEPQGCRDDCRFHGPAHEAVQAFVAFLGSDLRVRETRLEFNELFADTHGRTIREAEYTPEPLASGRCDFYPINLAKTPWRMNKVAIATMFSNRRMVVVRDQDADNVRTLSDLAGKSAAVDLDTSYHTWLQEQNRQIFASSPVTVHLMSTTQALQAVSEGRIDFTVIDADAAMWAIRHNHANLRMAFPVGPVDEIGWATRREDPDLHAVVVAFFTAQREDATSALNDIWRRYFGMDLNQFIGLIGSIQE